MHPLRRKRLIVILFILAGVALTATLALLALEQNIAHHYSIRGRFEHGSGKEKEQI